jgi:hypothetical protein
MTEALEKDFHGTVYTPQMSAREYRTLRYRWMLVVPDKLGMTCAVKRVVSITSLTCTLLGAVGCVSVVTDAAAVPVGNRKDFGADICCLKFNLSVCTSGL